MSVIQTSQLKLHKEIIAVVSNIHTKHINAMCGQNTEFLNAKTGVQYSDHWAFRGLNVGYTNKSVNTV